MSECRYMIDRRCTNRLALPVYGARPSSGICRTCEYRDGLRGLGDAVAWVLSWTPARRLQKRGCGGCKRRQEALNRAVPARGCGKCGKSTEAS